MIKYAGIVLCLINAGFLNHSFYDETSARDAQRGSEYLIANIIESFPSRYLIEGQPKACESPWGKAILFHGSDAIVLDTNLLSGMRQFTIEVIFRPDTNGLPEQRFLHFGEVNGDRVMIETRLTKDGQWYLDTFMKSGQNRQTLVDSTKLHPLNQWYHAAFVVENGKMTAFVDGKKEIEGEIPFLPFSKGQTSIGVRLNRMHWFKGALYKLKITPLVLDSKSFIQLSR